MATLVGTEGSVVWLVAVLLLLTAGLGAALLVAIRAGASPRARTTRRP